MAKALIEVPDGETCKGCGYYVMVGEAKRGPRAMLVKYLCRVFRDDRDHATEIDRERPCPDCLAARKQAEDLRAAADRAAPNLARSVVTFQFLSSLFSDTPGERARYERFLEGYAADEQMDAMHREVARELLREIRSSWPEPVAPTDARPCKGRLARCPCLPSGGLRGAEGSCLAVRLRECPLYMRCDVYPSEEGRLAPEEE